jgi:hypothetical protein
VKDYQVVALIAAIVQSSTPDDDGGVFDDDEAIGHAMGLMELASISCDERRGEVARGEAPPYEADV